MCNKELFYENVERLGSLDFYDILPKTESLFSIDEELEISKWLTCFILFRIFSFGMSLSLRSYDSFFSSLFKYPSIFKASEISLNWIEDLPLNSHLVASFLSSASEDYVSFFYHNEKKVFFIPSYWVVFLALGQIQKGLKSSTGVQLLNLIAYVSYNNLLSLLEKHYYDSFLKFNAKGEKVLEKIITSNYMYDFIISDWNKILDVFSYIAFFNFSYLTTSLAFKFQLEQIKDLSYMNSNIDFYFYDIFSFWLPFGDENISKKKALESMQPFFFKDFSLCAYFLETLKVIDIRQAVENYWCIILPQKNGDKFLSNIFSDTFSKDEKQPPIPSALMLQFLEVWENK